MLRSTTLGVLTAALLATSLTGCLIGSNERETLAGKQVSDATFNRIQPGVTTTEWIQGTLGEPSTKSTLSDGTEVWKWSYTKTKASSGTVLFLFGGSSSKTTAGSAYVEAKNGIVTKAWRTDE